MTKTHVSVIWCKESWDMKRNAYGAREVTWAKLKRKQYTLIILKCLHFLLKGPQSLGFIENSINRKPPLCYF